MRLLLLFGFMLLAATVPAQDPEPAAPLLSAKEQRLQAVVDELAALVEKHSELRFERPPKVRPATHKQWREIVEREFEPENARELFELSIATQALYLVESDEIALSPIVVAPLTKELDDDAPRHHVEAVAHQKATVAHELVHVLQEAHFGLSSKLLAATEHEDIARLKFVLEGHAVLIEERIAEQELGLVDFLARGPYGGLGADPSYLTGRRYCLYVLRTEGMAGVLEKLAQPPSWMELLEVAEKQLPPEAEASRESGGAVGR
jgi:hypothetical protein